MFYFISRYFIESMALLADNEVSIAIKEILAAFSGKRDVKQMLSQLESKEFQQNLKDSYEYLIFQELKAKLFVSLSRYYEAITIIEQIKEKFQSSSQAEVRWIIASLEICMNWYEGKREQAMTLIDVELIALNPNTKLYTVVLLEYMLMLGAQCKTKKVEEIAKRLQGARQEEGVENLLNIVLYLSYVYACDDEKAEVCMHAINWQTALFTYFQPAILNAEKILFVVQYNLGKRDANSLLANIDKEKESHILIFYHLLERDISKAKELLQSVANTQISREKQEMLEYLNIHLALSEKDTYLARALIKKSNSLSEHVLNFLFLARTEYLEGNLEKALSLFSIVYEKLREQKALSRLEWEMDLAYELKNRISRLFWQSVYKNNEGNFLSAKVVTQNIHFGMIGESELMKVVYENIKKYGPIDLPVLIVGETGTGKELTAQALHKESSRKDKPFLAINCGAISEELLQSELFGHKQGAFTSATSDKVGILEAAGEGSVFLDEIGEIVPAVQIALLRVLENNEIRSIGSSVSRKLKCRIIAATNASLTKLVEQGKFRKDLLYRLQRFQIFLPALRERRTDIKEIAMYFLSKDNQEQEIKVNEQFIKVIENYDWPGNIRELRNEMEKLVLLNPNQFFFTEKDLPSNKFNTSSLQVKEVQEESMLEPLLPNENMHIPKMEEEEEGISQDLFSSYLNFKNSPLRRKEKIKKLFYKHKNLSRSEIARGLNIALNTAARDLLELEEEGFIIRVKPSSAPRTHFFTLNRVKISD